MAATATATGSAEVVWEPHPGSQELFLACPIFEALYEGTRGPGKTDALLMDFLQHVGEGFGPAWRGILFRQEYKPLGEVVNKSKRFFPRIFPDARFLSSATDLKWIFPEGEELLFRAFKHLDDYDSYHGHEYPWIGWDELTTWPSLDCYHVMKSCCRSTHPGVPRKYRGTTNPYGRGHNAVKAYFIDPAPAGVPFTPPQVELPEWLGDALDGIEATQCVRLRGHYTENLHLMRAQPNYPQIVAQSARNPEQARAWLAGDWDIVAGGMFDDVWSESVHVIPRFEVPPHWPIDRSFDWGSSKPFSVGWWTEVREGWANPRGRYVPKGSLIRIGEWYGWDGRTPNVGIRMPDVEIARGVVEREKALGIRERVRPGPADTSIFFPDPGKESIAQAMARCGVAFTEADKGKGSREQGWEVMRRMMKAALDGDRESPHLYVTSDCAQFRRTVPVLPRDEKNLDDVDTEAEDHIADEVRYRVRSAARRVTVFRHRV